MNPYENTPFLTPYKILKKNGSQIQTRSPELGPNLDFTEKYTSLGSYNSEHMKHGDPRSVSATPTSDAGLFNEHSWASCETVRGRRRSCENCAKPFGACSKHAAIVKNWYIPSQHSRSFGEMKFGFGARTIHTVE